jgi:hypothetical protein
LRFETPDQDLGKADILAIEVTIHSLGYELEEVFGVFGVAADLY